MEMYPSFYLCEWAHQTWKTRNPESGIVWWVQKTLWLVVTWESWLCRWLGDIVMRTQPLNSFTCKIKVLKGTLLNMFAWALMCFTLVRNEKRKQWFSKCDGQPHPTPSITGGLAVKVTPQPLSHIPQVEIYEVKEVCHLAHCRVFETCSSVWRDHWHAVVFASRAVRHMSWVCTMLLWWIRLTSAFPEIGLASSTSDGSFALWSWARYHPVWVLSSGQCFLC